MAEQLPAIERPNGKVYRPRKITGRILSDEAGIASCVLVTGTHDIGRALPLARVVAREHVSPSCEPADPEPGWWRETCRDKDPVWAEDDVRGAAGIMFGSIREASGA